MVHVQLAQNWTDGNGGQHSAGDMVDVDAGTLAQLEEAGIVANPSSGDGGGGGTQWPGPTSTGGEGDWPGPTA